ncbi:Leucine-, glutamate- and lysine-rich protein 1 [Branchiostoma belcheri]|nr:Leucine-, glutamate- and lysine-rich protein 1 [Branchiostoma belcheri]
MADPKGAYIIQSDNLGAPDNNSVRGKRGSRHVAMSPILERHVPEHPLPDELQLMERDDTICKFCGVSYLIHHEIKRLEDQVKYLEEELEQHTDCEERDERHRNEYSKLQEIAEDMQHRLGAKEASIASLTQDLQQKDAELDRLREQCRQNEEKAAEQVSLVERLRNETGELHTRLPTLLSSVRNQRACLQNIQTFVHQRDKVVQDTTTQITKLLTNMGVVEMQEMEKLKKQIEELTQQKSSESAELSRLTQELQKAQGEVGRLQGAEQLNEDLKQKFSELQREHEAMKTQQDNIEEKTRTITSELAQYKELVRSKTQEVENLNTQLKKRDQIADENVARLQRELKQCEVYISQLTQDCQGLRNQLQDQNNMEEEFKRKASMSLGEAQEIKSALMKAQEELKMLKDERELMVVSHQNRIDQLRDSFRKKLQEAEQWPGKMEDILRQERENCTRQLEDLEFRLKESYRMDVEIERQKHQEMIDRYIKEKDDLHDKLKTQASRLTSEQRASITNLERQLNEVRGQADRQEAALKQEVSSLKRLTSDLQTRLSKAEGENDEQLAGMKELMRQKEEELAALREENKELEEKNTQTTEEIAFLQETVRRECEERFELTEALSEAREQLLTFQRPPAGFSSNAVPRPPSGQKSRSENSLRSSTNSFSSTGSAGSGKGGVRSSSSNVSVSFEGAKPTGDRGKGSSMNASRKRIAAAMGRR